MTIALWITFGLIMVALLLSLWVLVLVRELENENARLTEFIEWYVNTSEYEYINRRETHYDSGDS
jgi:hypothetical protein